MPENEILKTVGCWTQYVTPDVVCITQTSSTFCCCSNAMGWVVERKVNVFLPAWARESKIKGLLVIVVLHAVLFFGRRLKS